MHQGMSDEEVAERRKAEWLRSLGEQRQVKEQKLASEKADKMRLALQSLTAMRQSEPSPRPTAPQLVLVGSNELPGPIPTVAPSLRAPAPRVQALQAPALRAPAQLEVMEEFNYGGGVGRGGQQQAKDDAEALAERRKAEWLRVMDERRRARASEKADKTEKTKPTALSDEEVALTKRRREEWLRDLDERRRAKERRRASETADKEIVAMESSLSTAGSSKLLISPDLADSGNATALAAQLNEGIDVNAADVGGWSLLLSALVATCARIIYARSAQARQLLQGWSK